MTNNNEYNDIIEAGNHPADTKTSLKQGLRNVANDPTYDGQSVALYRNGEGELVAEPEPTDLNGAVAHLDRTGSEDDLKFLLEEDEETETVDREQNYGVDVIR